ncbi:MAG TPA: c-type cytochrome [Pyrinomonadaceae bacterium]|nr:c-type cytochrome [Pyrinomonadaceae bacterium]
MNENRSSRLKLAACVAVLLALASAWLAVRSTAVAQGQAPPQSNQQAQPAQTPQGQPPGGQQQPPPENPIVAEIRKRIAGQEEKPAEEVFKNIQVLKGVPAGRLLSIMERGYTRALGVRCNHCHVPGEWEKDDKETKLTARDMVRMNATINAELKKIKTLVDNPTVNCSTCHRGQPKPGANRPEGGARPQPQPTPSPTP